MITTPRPYRFYVPTLRSFPHRFCGVLIPCRCLHDAWCSFVVVLRLLAFGFVATHVAFVTTYIRGSLTGFCLPRCYRLLLYRIWWHACRRIYLGSCDDTLDCRLPDDALYRPLPIQIGLITTLPIRLLWILIVLIPDYVAVALPFGVPRLFCRLRILRYLYIFVIIYLYTHYFVCILLHTTTCILIPSHWRPTFTIYVPVDVIPDSGSRLPCYLRYLPGRWHSYDGGYPSLHTHCACRVIICPDSIVPLASDLLPLFTVICCYVYSVLCWFGCHDYLFCCTPFYSGFYIYSLVVIVCAIYFMTIVDSLLYIIPCPIYSFLCLHILVTHTLLPARPTDYSITDFVITFTTLFPFVTLVPADYDVVIAILRDLHVPRLFPDATVTLMTRYGITIPPHIALPTATGLILPLHDPFLYHVTFVVLRCSCVRSPFTCHFPIDCVAVLDLWRVFCRNTVIHLAVLILLDWFTCTSWIYVPHYHCWIVTICCWILVPFCCYDTGDVLPLLHAVYHTFTFC